MSLQHNIFLYLRRMESLPTNYSEDQLEIFYKLAKSNNAFIRSQVTVLLADRYTPRSEEVLFELLDDPEDLVRTEAADSMGIGRSIKSLEKIFEMLQSDPYYLARGYAVYAYKDLYLTIYGETETSKRAVFEILKECLQKEEDEWVQICYYDDFYTLGEKQYLENLLCLLSSEDSVVSGSVAASLCEHIDEKNYQTNYS